MAARHDDSVVLGFYPDPVVSIRYINEGDIACASHTTDGEARECVNGVDILEGCHFKVHG